MLKLLSFSDIGFLEALRGKRGHRFSIAGPTIKNDQMAVPTTRSLEWRCAGNIPGPIEKALVGLLEADPSNPLEVIRVVHAPIPAWPAGVRVINQEKDTTHRLSLARHHCLILSGSL